MTRRRQMTFLLAGLIVAGSCSDNPVAPHEDDLDVTVSFSLEHLMTLTEIEVEASIRDEHGEVFTHLSSVAVEFRLDGDSRWRSVDMEAHDGHFEGRHMFFSSGDYEMRLTGVLDGQISPTVLHEGDGLLEVERIHSDVGGYRVEFETFPGHVHEGQTADVRFWVLEPSEGGHSHGHGVEGLDVDIVCTESDGRSEEHHGHGHDGGLYEASHTFLTTGGASMAIHFTDPSGTPWSASFITPVSHQH